MESYCLTQIRYLKKKKMNVKKKKAVLIPTSISKLINRFLYLPVSNDGLKWIFWVTLFEKPGGGSLTLTGKGWQVAFLL